MAKETKFRIIDESGDKKYFTIIPNYIVNHSTPYEQSLYLFMKRIAGENGTCWMSASSIGKKLGTSANTIKKYRKKLVERGWIKKIGEVKTGQTNQIADEYRIVDLWELNAEYYKKVSNDDSLKVSTSDEKVSTVDGKVSPVGRKEEPIKKIYKEELAKANGEAVYGNQDVSKIIGSLKEEFELPTLDGSQAENRKYAWLAIKKCNGVAGVLKIIKLAAADDFYGDKISSVKKLYYHMVEIVQKARGNKQSVVKIR